MADITNTKTYFLTQAQYETLRTGGTTEVTDYNGNKNISIAVFRSILFCTSFLPLHHYHVVS